MTVTHTTPETQCPVCLHINDRATSVDDHAAPPVAGDFTVCGNCACILVFDTCKDCGELDTRLPHPNEAIELEAAQPGIAETLAAMQRTVIQHLIATRPDYQPPWLNGEAITVLRVQ
jgi:hypothetical protein